MDEKCYVNVKIIPFFLILIPFHSVLLDITIIVMIIIISISLCY